MTIVLREFQEDMLGRTRELMKSGVKSILMQAPTGAGKTVLAGQMLKTASERGFPSWFICHRRELVVQSSRTFARFGIEHGIVAAGFQSNRFQPVQVCGIQTLANRYDRLPRPGFIVWDEAHHVAASSWAKIRLAFPDAIHVGLSATPERLDGTGLRDFFSHMVPGPAVAELIRDGYLSDYKLFQPTSSVDLSGVHKSMGDFNKRELEAALEKSSITGDALNHYKSLAMGKRAVMFNASIKRSLDAVDRFNAAGIPAMHVDGETDPAVRDDVMRRFGSGELLVLSNVDLFGEGVDVPAIEAVIDCAPSMSLSRVMQRWGRALRPAEGKTHAILLDHAGNSKRHGLPDDDREWTLDGRRKSAKKTKDPEDTAIKTCPLCFSVVTSVSRECRHCGHVFAKQERTIEERDGELTEVDRETVKQQARQEQAVARTLDDLVRVGQLRGYKRPELWARHVYRARQSKGAHA